MTNKVKGSRITTKAEREKVAREMEKRTKAFGNNDANKAAKETEARVKAWSKARMK